MSTAGVIVASIFPLLFGASAPQEAIGLLPVKNMPAMRHETLKLVEGGKLNFAIVGRFKDERDFRGPEGQKLDKFDRNVLKRAADTLVWAFDGAFGVKPDVLEEDDPKLGAYKYIIALGSTRLSAELGLVPERLPCEGFEIKSCSKGVAIAGMDGFRIPGFYDRFNWRSRRINCNGTLWGAIDFAERFLGSRKFSLQHGEDYFYTPSLSSLSISPIHYSDHPRQHFRAGNAMEGWRVGTSTDFFGGEAPGPFDMAKAHPDEIEKIFYRDTMGRLWYDPQTDRITLLIRCTFTAEGATPILTSGNSLRGSAWGQPLYPALACAEIPVGKGRIIINEVDLDSHLANPVARSFRNRLVTF